MTKIKRRLMASQETVMCSRELWRTMCQMEQFKEQRDITEVLLSCLESQNLWAAQTSGKDALVIINHCLWASKELWISVN